MKSSFNFKNFKITRYFCNFATELCGGSTHTVVYSTAMHALGPAGDGGGLLEPFSPWFLCVSFTFQAILSTQHFLLPEEILNFYINTKFLRHF